MTKVRTGSSRFHPVGYDALMHLALTEDAEDLPYPQIVEAKQVAMKANAWSHEQFPLITRNLGPYLYPRVAHYVSSIECQLLCC